MRENPIAKALQWLIYLSAFVPLIIFKDYISPFHFGKVVILRSWIEIMLVLFLLLIWRDRSYLPKFTKITWAFLFFTIAFSITTLTSVIPYMSFWGTLERMGGVFTFWHYFVYFIILTSVFRKESDWINLFRTMIVVGVMSAFYGFLQRTDWEWVVGSGNRSRIFGTIGNPALFAGYQIICAFLGLTLFFHKNNSLNWKTFYSVSSLILFIAALMTAVRGSMVGIVIGLLAFALLYTAAYRSKKARKVLLGFIAFIFLFVVLALLMRNTSLVQNSGYLKRITNFSPTDYTIQTRFWAWEAGIKGWKETPKTILLGWGPENFNIPFSKYFNPKFYRGPGSETLFDRAHNMFVEILVTMGLLGLLSYLWIFISSFKVLWKKLHEKETILYGVGLIPLLIAYAVHNSFIFDTSANFLTFFTALGFISFISMPKGQDIKPKPVRVNQALFALSAIVLMIVTTVFIYKINVIPAKANYASTRAIIAGWADDFPGAIKKYQETLAYDSPGKYEFRHRFAQYVLEETSSGEIKPEWKDALLLVAEEVMKNVNENPVDYLPYLYEARIYIVLGRGDPASPYNDKSLEFSLKALELAPEFVRTYYEIAQGYLNKNDYANAAKYFKRAMELNPEVGLSHWYYGFIEMENGNVELGLKVVEEAISSGIYIPNEGDLKRLVNVYLATNDFYKLAWAYEFLVKVNPKDPQSHASLAVSYSRIGRIVDAVIQAKEAARLDPNFESEARSFVASLGRQW